MTTNYDKLAEGAERGELKVKPGTVRRSPEAAADAQRLLMETTGATNATETHTHCTWAADAGNEGGGASPVVLALAPQALKDRVVEVDEREHRKESDVVEDALAGYVKVLAAG